MEPIRVLQVVGRMDRGGIETLIMNLYRNIDRNKVQFDFLAHYGREAEYNEEIRSLGGRIFEMPSIKSTTQTNYHKVFSYVHELNKFFKEHKEYKIVHGHMTNTASIYMPIAAINGVKCRIVHSHLSKSRKGISGMVTDLMQIPIEKVANEYFACSESAAKWLFSQENIAKGNVKIINNAIDSKLFKFDVETRTGYRKLLKLENNFVIGHVGRFYHEKNHEYLINIFNEVIKAQPNARLLLIGDGVLKDKVKQLADSLGLQEKVIFLGTRSDISNLMMAMDVFVMPSHFEGLPVVGVEAQASGLACIMSDNVTNEIDITGRVDFISLEKSPKHWAEEILKHNQEFNRENNINKIISAGYDIKTNVQWIQEFYLNKHNS